MRLVVQWVRRSLTVAEREEVAHHLEYYHGFHMNHDTKLNNIVPILPRVVEKIASNLECHVRDLENRSTINV